MTTVGPDTHTTVPLVYDLDDRGLAGGADMTGPVVGTVRYRQDPVGSLEMEISIGFGHPNRRYDVALTAGPSHNLAAGWVVVGQVSTNAAGQGSVAFVVPAGVVVTAPFGPGPRADHIDVLELGSGLSAGGLTAGAINYFVCRRRLLSPVELSAEIEEIHEPVKAGEGDPLEQVVRD